MAEDGNHPQVELLRGPLERRTRDDGLPGTLMVETVHRFPNNPNRVLSETTTVRTGEGSSPGLACRRLLAGCWSVGLAAGVALLAAAGSVLDSATGHTVQERDPVGAADAGDVVVALSGVDAAGLVQGPQ